MYFVCFAVDTVYTYIYQYHVWIITVDEASYISLYSRQITTDRESSVESREYIVAETEDEDKSLAETVQRY